MTDEKQTWYLLFGGECAGGYGYWLSDSENEARTVAVGERSAEERCVGCFPSSKVSEAKNILDEACEDYPDGGEPDRVVLGKRIRDIGGWNEL